ncbi:MAG: low molecular weight phosphatase family protein [Solirubrobacterales bacterium]
MANALFVCLHNAGRSQMSQALFERAGDGRREGRSAGTTPGEPPRGRRGDERARGLTSPTASRSCSAPRTSW